MLCALWPKRETSVRSTGESLYRAKCKNTTPLTSGERSSQLGRTHVRDIVVVLREAAHPTAPGCKTWTVHGSNKLWGLNRCGTLWTRNPKTPKRLSLASSRPLSGAKRQLRTNATNSRISDSPGWRSADLCGGVSDTLASRVAPEPFVDVLPSARVKTFSKMAPKT